MEPLVRVVGLGRPLPVEKVTGTLPPGPFQGGDHVAFDGALVERVDFSRRRFEYLATAGSTFIDCDFTRVRIRSGFLDASRTSRFIGCRFDGLQPGALLWGVSRFEHCSFENVRWKGWQPDAAEFVECRFSGRFDGVVWSGVPVPPFNTPDRLIPWRTRNEFRGNDFSRADLRFPEFRNGLDVLANTWPSGPSYLLLDRLPERIERALAEVSRWAEGEQRERALWWLRLHREAGGQAEVLIRPADWDVRPAETWPRLWASLEARLT
jgi:hypothetical protein